MKIECDIKYDFDDVLIKPKRSNAPSRKSVSLEREFIFPVSGVKWVGCPVIAANMYATGTFEMANVMCNSPHNMMVCLHKHYTDEQIIDYYRTCETKNVFYTTGIKDEDFERIKLLSEYVHLKNICVDAANGHTEYFVKRVRQIRDYFPSSVLMAGNVATSEMVQELILAAGVEIIKCGIGGGCFISGTKVKTQFGYKNIEDVEVDEMVYTHTGDLKRVESRMSRLENEVILDVNGIKCTKNHEFYVLHKMYKEIIDENNIHLYAKWVSAEELSEEYFLIKLTK